MSPRLVKQVGIGVAVKNTFKSFQHLAIFKPKSLSVNHNIVGPNTVVYDQKRERAVVTKYFLWACTWIGILSGGLARAQDAGSSSTYEFGFHLGDLLPNQIPGVTEVMGMGGLRAGVRVSPVAVAEAAVTTGNGDGAEWKNADLGVRLDMPIDTLVGFVLLGADLTDFQGVGQSEQIAFGGHLGGGLMTSLGGSLWFRSDMKFMFNPGISLYIDFSLLFRL
jgi:hypothetical protein